MSSLASLLASSLPIEVKRSIPKTILLLVGCVAFTAVGVSMFASHRAASQGIWVDALCIAFFGFGGLVALALLFDNRPRLLLNDKGVWVRGWKGCPIAWGDIERAWKYEQDVPIRYGQVKVDYVCLSRKHADAFHGRQGRIARYVAAYGRSRGMGDLYFSTKGMDVDTDGLVQAIQSHIGAAHLLPVESLVPIKDH